MPYELIAQENQKLSPFYYPEFVMVGFAVLASWALFAASNTTLDAIKYAEYRAVFSAISEMSEDELNEYLDSDSDD